MAVVAQQKDEGEEGEEDVADEGTERCKREQHVGEYAAAQQGKQVEQGFAHW